jgi:hypothetical protein
MMPRRHSVSFLYYGVPSGSVDRMQPASSLINGQFVGKRSVLGEDLDLKVAILVGDIAHLQIGISG